MVATIARMESFFPLLQKRFSTVGCGPHGTSPDSHHDLDRAIHTAGERERRRELEPIEYETINRTRSPRPKA